MNEKRLQGQLKKNLERLGFFVSDFSQSRATQQTEGIPDLLAMHPRWELTAWIEVKTGEGELREVQRNWHERARAAGENVIVVRSTQELVKKLGKLGAPLQ